MAQPKKKKLDGLLSCLAYEATKESCQLLKKHGVNAPKDHSDLEYKLADLYRNSVDKKAMDAEFCAIHPHKEFILRYSEPIKSEETHIDAPDGAILTEDKVKQILKEYIGEPKNNYSNCEGNPNCNCGKSGFSGHPQPQQQQSHQVLNTTNIILGVLGIVAITGILMQYKNK